MDDVVKQQLICMANNHITGNGSDPAHDFGHALRVMQNAEKIGLEENGDLEILIPAALFHDAVTWPKNDQRSTRAQDESAKLAKVLLCCTSGYPQDKITEVVNVIEICSFSKNIHPVTKEGMILQDADGLEATGAIAIMRTFSSGGSMDRALYHFEDPFCLKRQPDDMQYSLDLFYTRLLKIVNRMHTETGQRIAQQRTAFLENFLDQAKDEIFFSG